MTTIFITGGSGFLGSNIINGLSAIEYEIYALTRDISKMAKNGHNVHYVEGDLNDIKKIECPNFDVCLHFAWGGVNRNGVADTTLQLMNYENTCKLLDFCRMHNCKTFIDAGSRQEYMPTESIITEDTTCAPISEYGKWKLKAHDYAKKFCEDAKMQYIHFRIFSVYGPGDHPWSLISTLVEKLSHDEDVQLGACTQYWSFMHISDFVRVVLCTINQRAALSQYEVFNIASEDIRVLKEFILEAKDILKSNGKLLFDTFAQNSESAMSLKPSIEKAKTMLKWKEQILFFDGVVNCADILNARK